MRVRGISLVVALLAVAGCANPSTVVPPQAASFERPGGVVVESVLPVAARRALDRTLDRYLRERPGRAALAVYDRTTGARYSYRERTPFVLASVAKVDILLAFLLGKQGELSAYERTLTSKMIRESDNDCAHELYLTIGGQKGLTRVLRQLGVEHTWPGPGLYWGTTRSRPSDQVKVLERLTDPAGPLPASDRRYALKLMSSVEPSQAWGVSAAGGDVALKNGWLPVDAHDGLWTINSVGQLGVDGHDVLIAVLSERSPTMETGIATVERLAKLAVEGLTRSQATFTAAQVF
ncbi:serine hydrolase [Nonomuraea sp. NPDC050451]|uniref:serine hydrolase n=1 Tax=Nonomuraea sp. NPDC050451 TaxID=3364364 RepID=UPI0037A908CE